jgi:hypothetical protein
MTLPQDILYEIMVAAAAIALAEWKFMMNQNMRKYIRFGTLTYIPDQPDPKFLRIVSPFGGINQVCKAWAQAFARFVNMRPEHARLAAREKSVYAPDASARPEAIEDIIVYLRIEDHCLRPHLRNSDYAAYTVLVPLPRINTYIWLGSKACRHFSNFYSIITFTKGSKEYFHTMHVQELGEIRNVNRDKYSAQLIQVAHNLLQRCLGLENHSVEFLKELIACCN